LYQYAKTSILPDILSENDKISKYIRQTEVASQFFLMAHHFLKKLFFEKNFFAK